MNARIRAALVSLCSLFLVVQARPVHAQSIDSIALFRPAQNDTRPVQRVGPTREALSVAAHPMMSEAPAPAAARSGGIGQPEAMMIVGGAAILVGAVIGGDAGDIFMIGGAVVGLVGLYKYLQ